MICNYADDNHLMNENNCIDLKNSFGKDAHRAILWFDNNYMDANPDKFQCISLDRFGRPPISISVEGNTIPSSDGIKVLGVTLDKNLQYNTVVEWPTQTTLNPLNSLLEYEVEPAILSSTRTSTNPQTRNADPHPHLFTADCRLP